MKTIKLEIGPKEISDIIYEWTNKRPTKKQAEQVMASIQSAVEERLIRELFAIVIDLVERM